MALDKIRIKDLTLVTDSADSDYLVLDQGDQVVKITTANYRAVVADNVKSKAYGAVGDGTTDDRAAIVAMAATGRVIFPKGTYRVATDWTVAAGVVLELQPGAVLKPDSGVTITIRGSVHAGLYQIFDGDGTIKLGAGVSQPKPHWWGIADQALVTVSAGAVLSPGVNAYVFEWTPDAGAIEWEATAAVRATIYDPDGAQGNLLEPYVRHNPATGQFTVALDMLVGVTLIADLKMHLEVVGMY